MSPRRFVLPLAWLTISPLAQAHRADEYLQATRISVDTGRIDLEIDLTPGMTIASKIFALIDTNRDGNISSEEGKVYAQQMLHSVLLKADGQTAAVTLADGSFPTLGEMTLGVGTIRLRASAKVPVAGAGSHQLKYVNSHRPETSVYLVNALVPSNPRIRITDQNRDTAQLGMTLDYTVQGDAPPAWTLGILAGLGLVACWFLRSRATKVTAADQSTP